METKKNLLERVYQPVERLLEWAHKKMEPNLRNIPEQLKQGIHKQYKEDEIIFVLRSNYIKNENMHGSQFASTAYNTHYEAWLILTDKRIITARNFKKFREFVSTLYQDINKDGIQFDLDEGMLTIETKKNRQYICKFLKDADEYFEELDSILRELAHKAQHKKCIHCERELTQDSNFCPGCGQDLS